jgi:hypothetical protein
VSHTPCVPIRYAQKHSEGKVLVDDTSRHLTQPGHPDYLTIQQTADLMTGLGRPVSVAELRRWRSSWIRGDRRGPSPLLLSTRCLRYERKDVIKATRDMIDAARRAAEG